MCTDFTMAILLGGFPKFTVKMNVCCTVHLNPHFSIIRVGDYKFFGKLVTEEINDN